MLVLGPSFDLDTKKGILKKDEDDSYAFLNEMIKANMFPEFVLKEHKVCRCFEGGCGTGRITRNVLFNHHNVYHFKDSCENLVMNADH